MLFKDNGNYFKDLFSFPADSSGKYHGGFAGFTMTDVEHVSDFKAVNDKFKPDVNSSDGGFFVDSFTYTPFVDYSQVGEGGDSRVGVYSDQFLNDYNSGKYNDPDAQVDKHRRTLTSTLYELGNLKKDLEDAKIAFREAVAQQDRKIYIYTLCEHLATLFAKLSNIRMSHEIYGFKHPHAQWEGILALDIFYNLLYREIDAKYPFDDRFMNMNPMQRRPLVRATPKSYVVMDDGRKLFLNSEDGSCAWDNNGGSTTPASGLEWMLDETSDKFVYIWDSNLWSEYYGNSQKISDTRKECTTPRGVLTKMWNIVNGLEYKWEAYLGEHDDDDGDYKWFEQSGKVYSHWTDKSLFTKYANLHLGRAYEVMSGREYFVLTNQGHEGDTYTKPDFSDVSDKRTLLNKMMKSGFKALIDAFSVVQNEHLFNVFNSKSKSIEEFAPANVSQYSQSQCAIAIERVFSGIYKYLQFKSTTSETFQRHINIDSGYKYLTTDSFKKSDHELKYYYYPEDESAGIKPYLKYLKKLNEYVNSSASGSGIGLTTDEKAVLGEFCNVLSKETLDWLDKEWDLCPLLNRLQNSDELHPRELSAKFASRDANGLMDGDSSSQTTYTLILQFDIYGFMD